MFRGGIILRLVTTSLSHPSTDLLPVNNYTEGLISYLINNYFHLEGIGGYLISNSLVFFLNLLYQIRISGVYKQ